MVISQQLVQEIQGLRADKVLIFTVDKPFPSLTGMSAEAKWGIRNGLRSRETECLTPTFSLVVRNPAIAKRSKLQGVQSCTTLLLRETTKLIGQTGNSSGVEKRNVGPCDFTEHIQATLQK